MIWLTWRQFRVQGFIGAAALAVVAVVYGLTGPHLAHLYAASGIATCQTHGECFALTSRFLDGVQSDTLYPALYILGAALLYLTPAIIGAFWGAPLVTRELESGTFRLAWNQSVTRTHWLTVKLVLIGLAAAAFAGLLSLMITWWASPIDRVGGFPVARSHLGRFSPVVFGARDIAPIGYAVFAFVLGVTIGLLIRRMLPAMAITLAVFAVVLLAWPSVVRPHLIAPVSVTAPVTVNLATAVVERSGEIVMPVTNLPGAWIVSNQTITASGQVYVMPVVKACASGTQQQCNAWFATQHLRRHITYQPASRYWTFQWYETGIFLAFATALAGFSVSWVRRHRLA
jgi:ABC-type transport system involved in multi-copper enzyme maturation permease subunit